jgi:hypothetical protein
MMYAEQEREKDTRTTKLDLFRSASPRMVAARIFRDHPNWSDADLLTAFAEGILEAGEDCNMAALKQDAAPIYLAELRSKEASKAGKVLQARAVAEKSGARAEEKRRRQKGVAAAAAAAAAAVKSIVLLELMTPCGKALGECTGAECARMGGWYREVAKRVAPGKIVVKVLSEDEVQALWKAAKR